MTFSLVLLAAGKGKRFGGSVKKQFLSFRGFPLYQYSLRTFINVKEIKQIVVVCALEDVEQVRKEIRFFSSKQYKIFLTTGGEERYLSVLNGLQVLPVKTDFVLIHDAARPLISSEDILAIIKKAIDSKEAILPCAKVIDTIKTTKAGRVLDHLDREQLAAASTPQCMPFKTLLKGYQKCQSLKRIPTDDAEVISLVGGEIKIHWLTAPNPKVTTSYDIAALEL